ncbi:MAG: hypothetical protein M3R17_10905 [Bacteroidota bacterium]|nr:hypothetical protein [Bacteroidota bacterium]
MNRLFCTAATFAFLLFSSCNTDEDPKNVNTNDSLPGSSITPVTVTTALEVLPAPLPPGYALDTLSFSDPAKHFTAFFHFPVSSDGQLNELIKTVLMQHTKGYEDYHPREFETAESEVWISSFSLTGKFISMCFTDQSFSTGSAHFNHGYSTLTYDTLKHKQIFLTDIFNLRSEEEKQAFCDSVPATDVITQELLMPGDLHKNTDFMIDKGNLILYFDDYEKGPSMIAKVVALDDVNSFLRKEYKMLQP